MKIIDSISDIKQLKDVSPGTIVTIGNFDGFHLGHQEIIKKARIEADKRNTKLLAVTFEPHPVAVLYPQKAPGILTPLELKKYLMKTSGVDTLIVLKGTADFLKLSPRDFVLHFLAEVIKPSVIFEGEDFNFGQDRTGTIQTLKTLGVEFGFEVAAIPSKEVTLSTGQKIKVSSTIIRYMIGSGNIRDAYDGLGRYYRLMGKIIPGRGKGRELGFPTLNMERKEQIIPAEGVYAGLVDVGENMDDICGVKGRFPAVFSIGQARTFGDDFPLLIEAHLLINHAENIAGSFMAMDFVAHLRPQHKFNNTKELINQIALDCRKASELLDV